MTTHMMLYGGAFAALGVIVSAIMVTPTDKAFYRVALLLGGVGFFGGACLSEAVCL